MPAPAKLLRHCCRRRGRDIGRLIILGGIACAALTSCAVGPDYRPPEPPLPENFAATSSLKAPNDRSADRPAETTQWWRTLHDRELDSLVERAIAASPSLEIALDRLQQARAQEAVLIGAALPSAEASAGGGWGTGSDLARGRASQTLVSAETGAGVAQVVNIVGFDAAWELDIFGQFRRAIESAQYDIDAAIAARNVVLISLVADVTRAYLDLRALQMQLMVLRKNIEVAQKYLDFVQERYNRGITNELDVTLARRELAQLQAQVAPLSARIEAARYVIAVLIGVFPENLGDELKRPRDAAGVARPHPRRLADRSLAPSSRHRRGRTSIGERHGSDRRRHRGSVSAGGGDRRHRATDGHHAVHHQSDMVGWAGFRRIPLLDFGKLDAVVEKADYRTRELLAGYKQTVLNAVREVDTAIDIYAAQQDRLRHLAEALTAGAARAEPCHRTLRPRIDRFAQRHRCAAAGIRDRAAIVLPRSKTRRRSS